MNDYHFYYGLDHRPISDDEGHELLGDYEKRKVDYTELFGGRIEVSTVFTMYNYAEPGEEPILYETLVRDTVNDDVEYQERYTNPLAAHAGHEQAVSWARENLREKKNDGGES